MVKEDNTWTYRALWHLSMSPTLYLPAWLQYNVMKTTAVVVKPGNTITNPTSHNTWVHKSSANVLSACSIPYGL